MNGAHTEVLVDSVTYTAKLIIAVVNTLRAISTLTLWKVSGANSKGVLMASITMSAQSIFKDTVTNTVTVTIPET